VRGNRACTAYQPVLSVERSRQTALLLSCLTVLVLALASGPACAADTNDLGASATNELALIRLLKSNAPPHQKALACKELAIYGTKAAVPALAPLLADPHLASWARIPLEAIPGPAADAALRRAMRRLHGNLLIGVINSIGVRRDPKAVSRLVKKLKDPDYDVVSAAAIALGHIGGPKAAKALNRALATTPQAGRSGIAEGCILCAEGFMAQGKAAEAVKLYDAVRAAEVPRERRLEAIRGAILARGAAGLPLLLDQLRSPDKALFNIGLSTARELPGREVTEALAAELSRCSPERQSFLLLALGDRSDTAVLPVILKAARSGPREVRLTAVSVLDRLGNPSSLPVLLEVAADGDTELAQAALSALARLPGDEVDDSLLARFPAATGRNRAVLITLAGQRNLKRALPVIVSSAEDSDAGVRRAAVQTIGILGDEAQAGDLVRLLQGTQSAPERADTETALLAITGRTGARAVPRVLPLARSEDSALRIFALHVLASAGGPDALAAVNSAVQDKDEAVRDEAVRTLSTWPNNWPEDGGVAEPLLALARFGANTSHQVLALRGYLQYLQGDKQLSGDEKVSKLTAVLPLLKRPEEKRLAIAAIGAVPAPGALDVLVNFAGDPAVAEDACAAIVQLAGSPMPSVPKEKREAALQTVVEKATSDATKQKARALLKAAP
jgi:HEAT repeat protein